MPGDNTLGVSGESTEACVAEAEWMRVRGVGDEVTDVAGGQTAQALVSFGKGLGF